MQKNQEYICRACPRKCGVDRTKAIGFCGCGEKTRIARVGLHLWEEPCISYGKGSGTIFFSGCNLRCVFCQNYQISHNRHGKEITIETLAQEILGLQEQGAVNINLVTPSHDTKNIAAVLKMVRKKLHIPVIYNSSGYDSIEALEQLAGLIDIYLPDLKYYSSHLSKRYSGAEDYFCTASHALKEMWRQTGYAVFDQDGHIARGVMVRHLVLPSHTDDSMNVFSYLAREYDPAQMAVSVMSQYFPTHLAPEFPELQRRITAQEYERVVNHIVDLGFSVGFLQERSSAKEEYVPAFDYDDKNTSSIRFSDADADTPSG